jgi:hypothetical protein
MAQTECQRSRDLSCRAKTRAPLALYIITLPQRVQRESPGGQLPLRSLQFGFQAVNSLSSPVLQQAGADVAPGVSLSPRLSGFLRSIQGYSS